MSSSSSTNPAAAQGWVKSTDPKTGRAFYANHITRKTQWDAPEGWVEATATATAAIKAPDPEEPLPSNWEVMHDPTTGKPFYVDHERKITTWTRPAATDTGQPPQPHQKQQHSLQPAVGQPSPSSGNASAALARLLQQQEYQPQPAMTRSYQQEAAYYHNTAYHHSQTRHVDFSDALPVLTFTVQKVADPLRLSCAHCDTVFTYSKRRHHCRLCGDVFCDACSNHRVTLPAQGAEFDKPVRVCDYCQADCSAGNFFSFRRYLTPLHLSDPAKRQTHDQDDDGVASAPNVNAALAALTADVDQMLQNPTSETNIMDRISIPANVLIPEVLKHLHPADTADRSMCAIASLLAIEAMASSSQQQPMAVAVYVQGGKAALDDILHILERSGSDRKTLFVQEQAARTLCLLTEPAVVSAVLQQEAASDETATTALDALDIARAMRNMLDHSSGSTGDGNPNLQRWAAACIQHFIVEDQRRACLAMNEVAAAVASGQAATSLAYESCLLDSLVATGGIMILGSLIGGDDADTVAHAVAALGAALQSCRAVHAGLLALQEMTSGRIILTNNTDNTSQDASMVRAIVAAGGCGSSVAQLLLSADHATAGMGCRFLNSLVAPLLADPTAAASLHAAQYDYRHDDTTMGACREAAVELVTAGSCLVALLSLVRPNNNNNNSSSSNRPTELRQVAMETLAAVVYAVCEMGRVWSAGRYEEGLEDAPGKLPTAFMLLQQEGVLDTGLQVLQQSGQSLGISSSNNNSSAKQRETPSSRIREAAGVVVGAMTSCFAESIMELQSKQRDILSSLLLAFTDATMTTESTLRGDSSPRCLGVLETVSAVLMFAWQHPAGAASELLDRLMEVLDAGVIPAVSRVLTSPMDWDSRDKAVGAMKGRTAACRLLCSLFGIALSDPTGIGMRRLMEAVETDARSYHNRRSSNSNNNSNNTNTAPTNLIEAALVLLQTSSNLARQAVLGTLQQGPHYQAVLMELVDAALLAAASMCGSSVAPGGSEGSLVTGESFLSVRTDPYVSRRNEICKVACDVVVRGGRSGPALLPTMLIGGFGEAAVLSSLRLALAIAQNGTKDQHAKLALSGILVPISDSLRSALSNGDLYKFSAALALVRFCGPHIAAGHGGGLESVRDAIRVATNVLTLPVNPEASLAQIETQESLKSECISVLESLSHNASLWSSISTDALPSIVAYLHTTSTVTATHPRRQQTRCAALRAVLQIVQVPSHAVAVAAAGIAEPLGRLISANEGNASTTLLEEDEVPMLALEVLHAISSNNQARQTARFLDTGLVRCIFAALGKSATDQPKRPSDSRADVTFLGLEIVHAVLSDVEDGIPTHQVLQSPQAIAFVDAVATEPSFVRAMCSTLLLKTNMKLPRHDADASNEPEFDIPRTYGPPLILVPEKCAGSYENTHEASAGLLFRIAVYACAIESKRSDAFWRAAFLKDLGARANREEASRAAATFCAHFLSLLTLDHKPFVPTDKSKREDYFALTRPLVRHRLLGALKDFISEFSKDEEQVKNGGQSADPYVTSLLVGFNVPHICLSLWKDPALLDLAFELLRQIVDQDPDEVLHLFVEGKAAIESLFDMLNIDASFETSQNLGEIKRFLASVLGQLAENGMLKDAVERYDVRSSAIAALAAACLGEEERPPDEDEEMTSHRLSSVLMRCLVDLCSVKDGDGKEKKRIQLSSGEAEVMAKNLGTKICQMVISRFLERARLQQYEMEEDENIMEAPDVAMLCAIAQHREALLALRSIGGLHALSLVAAEGEISALVALKMACSGDVSILLEGDTYAAMMKMIADDESYNSQLETAAFDLIGSLCSGSSKGRKAVAADPNAIGCLTHAIHIIVSSCVSKDEDEEQPSNLEAENDDPENESSPVSTEEKETTGGMSVTFKVRDIKGEQVALGVAACSFLAAIAPTKIGSQTLRENTECIQALELIASSNAPAELQYAALNVLVALATYCCSSGPLTPDNLASALLFVLTSENKMEATERVNGNRLIHSACSGLAMIFDLLSPDKQKSLAAAAAMQFSKAIKSCIVTRSTTKDEERDFTAEAVYSLTVVLILARGREFVNDVFKNDILTSMLHLMQWRHDPKTSLGNTNKQYWDASVANCLLLLSTLLWRPEEELTRARIDLKNIAGTALMLARMGKAPRKAIDVKSVLSLLAESNDAAAAAPARRILDLLFS